MNVTRPLVYYDAPFGALFFYGFAFLLSTQKPSVAATAQVPVNSQMLGPQELNIKALY